MKRVTILFASLALSVPAFAQQAPTVDEVTNQYLLETGNLRLELGKARTEIAALKKALEEAKAIAKPKDK